MLKISEDFILKTIGNETVVVISGATSLTMDAMLRLNDSGTLLFKALKKGTTEDALVASLMTQYDVSIEQATQDVMTFINTLKRHQIL